MSTFQQRPIGAVVLDAGGLVCDADPIGAELLGLAPGSARALRGCAADDAGRAAVDALVASVGAGGTGTLELALPDAGRGPRRVELTAVPRRGAGGEVAAIALTVRAVPEAPADNALSDVQSIFHATQRLGRSGSFILDVATARVEASPPLRDLVEARDDEALDVAACLARVHPDDRARVGARLDELLGSVAASYEIAFRLVLPGERVLHVEGAGTIARDADGRPIRVLGVVHDVTERRLADEARLAHVAFLEALDRVNRAVHATRDLDAMAGDVLDAVLEVLGCDRAWLTYPCDPDATDWRIVQERTRPGYAGAELTGWLPSDIVELREANRRMLAAAGPVTLGPGGDLPLGSPLLERFGVRSQMAMVVHPRGDRPYLFGVQQCAYPRIWSGDERRLFQEVGRRLADALTSVVIHATLRESEARLAEAQRIAHIGYWEHELATNRVRWGDETYRIFGLRPQERAIDFEQMRALVDPRDVGKVALATDRAFRREGPLDVVFRTTLPDGSTRFIHNRAEPTFDDTGRVTRLFGAVQDVTERVRNDEALWESEEKYRTLVESSPDIVIRYDRDCRRVYVNPTYTRETGLRAGDTLGLPVDGRWLGWPSVEAYKAALLQVMATGVRAEINRGWLDPQGEPVTHALLIVPERDTSGAIVGALALGREMTDRRRAEDALRQSESRLAEAEGVAHLGYWERDLEHEHVTLSAEAARIFGLSPDERHFPLHVWHERFMELIHPTDRPYMRQRMAELLAGSDAHDLHFRIKRVDGEVRFIHGRSTVTWSDDGRPLRWFGVMQDVTEQRRADAALRENERLLSESQHIAHVGSWRVDDRDGRTTWSDETYRIFGVAPATFVPSRATLMEAVHPDDRAAVRAWIAAPDPAEVLAEIQVRIVRPDGAVRWVSCRGAVRRDLDGAYKTGTVQDITERRQTEAALRATERQLSALVDNLPDLVLRFDREGRYLYASAALGKRLGVPPESVIGKRRADLGGQVPEGQTERLEALVRQAFDEGRPNSMEAIWRVGDVDLAFEVRHVPERDGEGRVVSVLAIARDVTEARAAEARLRASESRFRAVIDHATDMVFILDPTGHIVDVNLRVTEALGYAREDLVGETPRRYDVGVASVEMRTIGERVAAGEIVALDRVYQRKDGTTFPVEVCIRAVRVEGQGFAVSMVRDITERKRTEERIRQMNRTYAVLSDINQLIVRERQLEVILRGSCQTAVEKGGFVMALIGLVAPDTVSGLAPPTGGDHLVLGAHAAHAGVPPAMMSHLFGGITECRLTAEALASGATVVCNDLYDDPRSAACREIGRQHGYAAMVSLPLTVGGRRVGVFNLYHAATAFFDAEELALLEELAADLGFAMEGCQRDAERQQALAQLRASEERFRELAETIEDVFWVTDAAKRRFLYVSPAYEKVWGRVSAELYRRPAAWVEAMHADDRERVAAAQAMQGQGVYDEEYRIVRPDGAVRWIRDRAFAVRGRGGELERLVGVARDITDKRGLEAQLHQSQKMEAIGQLAGGVAHDFNNLLGVMLMHAELAAGNEALDPETRASLGEIVEAVERAALLTRQLLTFSRRQMLQPRDVDLNEVVASVAKMLERIIGEDVRLELALHPRKLMLHADPGMLEQVLMNLSVNARDAMPGGGRLIIATTEVEVDEALARGNPDASTGRRLCLRVSDEGAGIPADVLPRIFEPFFTTKEAGKGTGLGLATVFGIVKDHQGWIDVDTEPGRGTTFRVYLPTLDGAPRVAPPEAPRARPADGSETVLLVEDEPAVRALARRILERHGYKVLKAGTGHEALELWAAHKDAIALVLTDLVMPAGMSGVQLAKQLLAERPQLRVLFMSGYNADMQGEELQLRHGEAFLKKPFGQDQLLAAVRARLDG